MRFPASLLDDIRDRLAISQVISASGITWDRRKTNTSRGDYWACCPFHGEKSPSFHCEDRKGRYHCFGCGVSGDHFTFLVEHDGVSFPEAVERLAERAGVNLPVMDRREQEREAQKASLFDVMAMAARFFEDQLQMPAGATARAYLRERGLSPRIQQTFNIGYAPDSRNLLKAFLAEKGVAKEQIEACGLVVHGPDIAVSYDRFRDRIMFPIADTRGRVIAFGGRALRADVPAKYLNSPETSLFHKSDVLYNHARARKSSRDRNRLIVAEGYTDVIAMHAAGFENAVAPLGTALTEAQLALLWRIHAEPVMCFDGDSAGVNAAYRVADLALPMLQAGRSLQFVLLPQGKDPDDILREQGPDAFQAMLEESLPLADLIWTRETAGGMFDTPEKRAELEIRIRRISERIGDEIVRRHYSQEMSDRLESMFGRGTRSGSGFANRPNDPRRGKSSGDRRRYAHSGNRVTASSSLLNSALVKRSSNRMPMREAALLAGILHHPSILTGMFEEFAALPLASGDARRIHGAILDILADEQDDRHDTTGKELAGQLRERGFDKNIDSMNRQLRQNRLWQALPDAAFEDALDGWRQAYRLHMKMHALQIELNMAESALASEETEENFHRLVQIRNELEKDEGTEALIEGFGVPSGRPSGNM
jgi:DNA primase